MRYSEHTYKHGISWNMCHMRWVTKYRFKVFSDITLKNLLLILLEKERLSKWYFDKGERSLWGDGKFMGSVGHITLEKAKEYLENQGTHHAKKNPHPLGLGSINLSLFV